MNKLGRFKTLAIATLSAIALAASIAVAQTVTPDQGNIQGQRAERRGGRGKHKEQLLICFLRTQIRQR